MGGLGRTGNGGWSVVERGWSEPAAQLDALFFAFRLRLLGSQFETRALERRVLVSKLLRLFIDAAFQRHRLRPPRLPLPPPPPTTPSSHADRRRRSSRRGRSLPEHFSSLSSARRAALELGHGCSPALVCTHGEPLKGHADARRPSAASALAQLVRRAMIRRELLSSLAKGVLALSIAGRNAIRSIQFCFDLCFCRSSPRVFDEEALRSGGPSSPLRSSESPPAPCFIPPPPATAT